MAHLYGIHIIMEAVERLNQTIALVGVLEKMNAKLDTIITLLSTDTPAKASAKASVSVSTTTPTTTPMTTPTTIPVSKINMSDTIGDYLRQSLPSPMQPPYVTITVNDIYIIIFSQHDNGGMFHIHPNIINEGIDNIGNYEVSCTYTHEDKESRVYDNISINEVINLIHEQWH